MFKQIKIRHISEEVFDQIKSAILERKLKPGEKLPTERELMKELGVSRVPIREALKLLVNMGFIETRQGGGSYVRSLLADRVRDPLNLIIKDNFEKVFELLEVRKEIETWSAYYAAQRATAEDIARIGHIVDEMETYFKKGKTPPVRLDADFHLAVAQCSCNTIQAHLTYTVYDIFKDYFNFLIENICFNSDYLQVIYNQHFEIYSAIRHRNGDEARTRIMEHLTFVEGELRRQTDRRSDETTGEAGSR
jgi:GntR family transcriptional regulator, transcriptional repressor for pyruvate dehydrogenase complex